MGKRIHTVSKGNRLPWAVLQAFAKTALPAFAGLIALVVVIAWLAGVFETKISPTQVERARRQLENEPTDVVHEIEKDYIEEAVGTLKSASRTVLSAKVLASIEEVAVSAGDQVAEGDILVRLDNKDLESRHKQAQQALIAATATRKEAETSFARHRTLVSRKAVSRAEYEESERRLEVARAEELRAEQAVNEAKIMLSYTTILAPRAGRIVDRLAESGDMARPGEPLLVLYDASSLRLEAPVLEELAVKLRPGDTIKVYIDAVQREIESTIDEIVPQADAPSRSFLVKATLPRAEDLYEGMFGRLRIPAGTRRHLCLETDAIQTVGQLTFVNVVNDDRTIERRLITTGRLGMPGRVEVLSGLRAGERVVLVASEQRDGGASDES